MLYRFMKKIHKITAFAGFFVLFGAVGKSDFYVLALRQPDPASVDTMIAWGLALMIPTALCLLLEYIKENKKIGR